MTGALATMLAASAALAAASPAGADAPLPPCAIASAPPLARGYAPVNGLRLYHEVHGPEGGTPIVLLHGGDPAIETSWERILPALARRHRVIAFDQQGHGRTADVDRPFTFEGSADDAAALLEYLKVARADLVGFSNGANVAMQVAIRHPRAVRRLVVASGMVKRAGLRPEFWEGMRSAKLEDMPPHFADVYRRTSPHPDRLPSYFRKSVDRMLGFRDWPDSALRSISAPALVVIGDADIVLPEHALEMARLLPRAGLAILPVTSHQAVVEDHADWLVSMIEAFLAERGAMPAATEP
ncbi:MAG TPA: alpha/beta fold hydrolase [Anaeromyxobacteraceae bacterium]|nr:alpha/beta fold hydrolase [Anaeromyxobacteraceae bacterium]